MLRAFVERIILRRILTEAQAIVGAALAAPTQQPEIASKTNLMARL
jgi:hypothetical protein